MIVEYNHILNGYARTLTVGILVLIIFAIIFGAFIVDTIIKGCTQKKRNSLKRIYDLKKKKWIKKKRKALSKKDFWDRLVAFTLVFVILIGTIVAVVINIVSIRLDISEETYVTYEGEFWVEDTNYGRGGPSVTLIFQNDKKAKTYKVNPYLDSFEEKNAYSGYVVYSKRSKIILDWGGELKPTDLPS